MNKACSLIILCAVLSACGGPAQGRVTPTATIPVDATSIAQTATNLPTLVPSPTDTQLPSATPETRLSVERWQEWPVVPVVQPEMKVVFERGLTVGNNPVVFMKIGDGEISTAWFLTQYDLDSSNYHLGTHTDLLPVIQQFQGSFGRVGLAAGRGFDTTIILGPAPGGTQGCTPREARLDCELRTTHPAFALLSLGTNQVWHPNVFEAELQQIIERLLQAQVVPVLSTKADNLEGDFRINQIIAQLAYEYNLPLWNFWAAVQPLPEHGLQADREHLTYADSDFSNPLNFQSAWPWRNLTALQTLDAVYRAVTNQP
jgi:hypothetical protein